MERTTIHRADVKVETEPQPRVLIIVLCYNGLALTIGCLDSLRRLTYRSVSVVIVDSASTDGTPAAIRSQFPDVEVIETQRNIGYAAGNNIGLRYALAQDIEYALILNNDTEFAPDLLERMLEVCQNDPAVGVVGPKIFYHSQQNRIWSAGGMIDWQRGISLMRGLDAEDGPPFDSSAQVDFVTGCALLVRRAVLEQVGLIDERFGMYFEEVEWCVRITRAGWRIVFAPQARVWHKISIAQQDHSPRITYYMARNRLLFLRLSKAPLQAWLHALLLQDLRTWCSWRVRRRWRNRVAQRQALCAAWRDFLLNRFGMVG